jgi:hypothetical protein
MYQVRTNIDFVAYDRNGRVLLLAEAKSRQDTSESWAAELRRNMLAHGFLPPAKYFMIATPKQIYLWPHEDPVPIELSSPVTLDAQTLLAPYFKLLNQEASQIGPEAFEYVVLVWLEDMARPKIEDAAEISLTGNPQSPWLGELRRSLSNAEIEFNGRR